MHIVFDLDGTLIDSELGIRNALQAACDDLHLRRNVPPLQHHIGPPIQILARTLWPDLTDEVIAHLSAKFRLHYDTIHCLDAPLYPDAKETLNAIVANGHQLYIATNKPMGPTRLILNKYNLWGQFVNIVCIDSQAGAKFANKASMLRHLMTEQKIPASSAIYIGDTAIDRAAANVVGIAFISATYGFSKMTIFDGDVGLIDSIAELPSLLRTLTLPTS